MEIIKTILKWTAIALAIIFGIILILVACMYFFPGFNIFGYRFIRNSSAIEQAEIVRVNTENTYYLIVTTNKFDIEINESVNVENIEVSYIDKKWGFANVEESKVFVNQEGNNISIRTLETSGIVFGSGKITVTTPIGLIPHLNITTTDGNIHIDKANVKSITTSMNNGDFTWVGHTYTVKGEDTDSNGENGEASTASADTENKEVTIEAIQDVTIQSLNIFCKGAKIDLTNFTNLNADSIYISANDLTLEFNNLIADLYIKCNSLNMNIDLLHDIGKLEIYAVNGSISIDTLQCTEMSTIVTDNANIYIRDCASIIDISSKGGNVQISNTSKRAVITTTKGNVNIASANDNVVITTNTGHINITEYNASAEIRTITGDITMNNIGDENIYNITNITQESGNISITTNANSTNIRSERGSNISMTIRSTPLNDNIKHEIFNNFGLTNLYILMTSNPFRVRAIGNVSGELASNVIMSSNTSYVDVTPPGYVGEVTEQTHLNVEGGSVVFYGLYE
ncbi:MAG: DUF4097 domain-containing protein [Clostridiales bacterium]|nr:DUF4097 domain-containing protein [Clostridiales bacterium]